MAAELGKRVATAAVLVPIVLAAVFLDPTHWSITVLAALVAVLAGDEVLRMALPVGPSDAAASLRVVVGGASAAIVVLSAALGAAALPPAMAAGVIVVGVATLSRAEHLPQGGRHFAAGVACLAYVAGLVAVLPLLKRSGEGEWLVVALCLAFFSDTVAYAVGLTLGRHKLYPLVSPGKTWEGSAGGIVGGCLATVGVGSLWLIPQLPLGHAVALGIVGSASGQAGDLVESMLKRTFGVKDSGRLLPGHGGILDRVDAMLFVAPVVYYYVAWLFPLR